MAKKILLSTDIGTDIDDALALALALNHPEINLTGVYTTNGDMPVRAKIAKRMVELAGNNATVAMGEAGALTGNPPAHWLEHERSFVIDEHKEKSPSELGIVEDGISDLVQKVSEGNITIASIAPLTNIARLLERDPQAHEKVDAVYVMGGRLNEPEHNFGHDVEAAQATLDSRLKLVVVSANVCEKYRKSLEEFKGLNSPTGRYIQEMLVSWNALQQYRSVAVSGITSTLSIGIPRALYHALKLSELLMTEGPLFARKNPREYVSVLESLREILKSNRDNPLIDKARLELEGALLKDVAIHDTYVIYSIAHPERVQTRDVKIDVGKHGRMRLSEGDKHKLVVDLDFDHFKQFLQTYLR